MKNVLNRNGKRFPGSTQNYQPRNENLSVMLSHREKNEFVEKSTAQGQTPSEKARSLILAYLYDLPELTRVIQELGQAKLSLADLEKELTSFVNESQIQDNLICKLVQLLSKNGIDFPDGLIHYLNHDISSKTVKPAQTEYFPLFGF